LDAPTRWERLEYELLMLLEPRGLIWERLQVPVTNNLHLELIVKKYNVLWYPWTALLYFYFYSCESV